MKALNAQENKKRNCKNQGSENQTLRDVDSQSRSLAFGYDDASDALFRQLHVLNYEYLKLLRAGGVLWEVGKLSSESDTAMACLHRLSESHLGELARCPSALFDLAFHDSSRWASLLSVGSNAAFSSCDRSISTAARFVDSALFFVWHALQNDARFARFAFGLPHHVAYGLKELPVTSLAFLARSAVDWLEPRWSRHVSFWPDLLRFAASNAAMPLQVTKLLSCQLLATANLESKTTFHVFMIDPSRR